MVHILSLAGDVLGTFTPERDPGFGVRTVAWHPAGLYLAVLGWDDKVSNEVPSVHRAQYQYLFRSMFSKI